MSSSILDMLAGQLDEQTIRQISGQLGADQGNVEQAVNAALPVLLGALDRNASDRQGAQALTQALQRDHDGSILDNLPQALSNEATLQDGAGILQHVLDSNRRGNVDTGLSRVSGLDQGAVDQLLKLLAPVVLGAIGKVQREQNLDADGLANTLHSERQEAESSLSGLARLLDLDQDGSIADEVVEIGSGLLRNFFGRR